MFCNLKKLQSVELTDTVCLGFHGKATSCLQCTHSVDLF